MEAGPNESDAPINERDLNLHRHLGGHHPLHLAGVHPIGGGRNSEPRTTPTVFGWSYRESLRISHRARRGSCWRS